MKTKPDNDPTTHRPEPTDDEMKIVEAKLAADPKLAASLAKAGITAREYAKHGARPEQLAQRQAQRSLRR
jgi:hypothetical protein